MVVGFEGAFKFLYMWKLRCSFVTADETSYLSGQGKIPKRNQLIVLCWVGKL